MAANPLTTGYEKLVEHLKSLVSRQARADEEEEGDTAANWPPPGPPLSAAPEPIPEPRELELGTEQHMEAMKPFMREVEADVEEDTRRRKKAAIMSDDFHEAQGEAIQQYMDAEPEKAELYRLNMHDWQDYLSLLSEREKRKAMLAAGEPEGER
jgi:hypothetical protein